jgi:hypothetical protein
VAATGGLTLRLLARRIQHLTSETDQRTRRISRVLADHRDYLDRRTTEGKTHREAIRCIKRYIALEVYSLIRNGPTPANARTSRPVAA